MKNAILKLTRISCLLAAACLYGCGAGDSKPISYNYPTLMVDGILYSPNGPSGRIVPGEIMVMPKVGMREEVRKLVERFDLAIAREERSYVLVRVRVGYERQWAEAFRRQDAVADATPTTVDSTAQAAED